MSEWQIFDSTGRIQHPDWHDEDSTWSAIFCGDWGLFGPQLAAVKRDAQNFYGDLLPVIQQADLRAVNVESMLGAGGAPIPKSGPHLKTDAEAVLGLTVVPFNLACLANNHAMDFGAPGLQATLTTLENQGIPYTGAGMSLTAAQSPFTTLINGVRVAVLNIAEGEEGVAKDNQPGVAPFDLPFISAQIAELRQQHEIVIVIAHAGREYIPLPPPYIQSAYQSLIRAGAKAVIAHHPHVSQGVEIYEGGLIAYSLGNFALWTPPFSISWLQVGYMIQVNFAGSSIQSAEIIPYQMFEDHLGLLKGDQKQAFLRHLHSASSLLTNPQRAIEFWKYIGDLWSQNFMSSEMIEIVASLMSDADLLTIAQRGLSGRTGLSWRILRRSLYWLTGKVSRTHQYADPREQRGAIILRNLFDTPAHRQLYLTALERVIHRETGKNPSWTNQFLEKWRDFKF